MKLLLFLFTLLVPQNSINNPSVTVTGPVMLGKKIGANFNSTADQAIPIGSGKYIVRRVIVTNASTSLTTAVGGVYTATAKGGTVVVASAQTYSFLTSATLSMDAVLTDAATANTLTAASLYLSLTTAQGAAATADIMVMGDRLQ